MRALLVCLFALGAFVADAHLNKEAYNESLANQWMRYAGVSYCALSSRGRSKIENWSCPTCKNLPHMNATTVHSNLADANGYVGYDAKNNFILVALTGTDPFSIRNWLDDLNTVQVDFPWCKDCRVHKGFYNTYSSISPAILALVQGHRASHPGAKVFVTGHSLGAAMATHCALDIIHQLKIAPEAVYNYGEPRVGNFNFSTYYTQNIQTHWRITHWKDPVPQLPQMWMTKTGFWHHVQEVWYNHRNTKYTLCDAKNGEDPGCSNGQIDLNVDDHLTYMDYELTKEYLACI